MEVERLRVALRPRTNWEATDLGVRFATTWYVPLQLVWIATALPFFLFALTLDGLIKQLFFIWWFKPIYERSVLTALSLLLFDEKVTLRKLIKGFNSARLLLYVSFFRFSWSRASNTPIDALEGLGSTKVGRRSEQLYRRHERVDFVISAIGLLVEISLVYSLVFMFHFLTQNDINAVYSGMLKWINLDEISLAQKLFWLVSAFIAMAVSAVFYVSVGFATYINCRTIREAWDIELGFKKLINRLGVLVLFVVVALPMHDALAQEDAQRTDDVVLAEVFDEPEFNQAEIVSVPIHLKNYIEGLAKKLFVEPERVRVSNLAANILKVIFIGAIVVILSFFFYQLWQTFGGSVLRQSRRSTKKPVQRYRETSLPRDFLRVIQDYWHGGYQREALALLYRSAITHIDARFNCGILTSDTEGECLIKTTQIEAQAGNSLKSITQLWINFAYGDREPSEEEFTTALNSLEKHIVLV